MRTALKTAIVLVLLLSAGFLLAADTIHVDETGIYAPAYASRTNTFDLAQTFDGTCEFNGNIMLEHPGVSTDSRKLFFYADTAGQSDIGSIYVTQDVGIGAPGLVISVPDIATGAETALFALLSTVFGFAADNTVDIGATGAFRPKDIFLGGNLDAEVGSITAQTGLTTDTGDVTATTGAVLAGTTVTATGDLIVNGGEIGLTGDLDLLQIAADSLTVNGDVEFLGGLDVEGVTSAGDIGLDSAGGDSNSYKVILNAHMAAGDETQTSSIFTAWGLDSYLVIATPDATGVETNTLHIDHNSFLMAVDNFTDIGSTGAGRPKDVFISGNLDAEIGAITAQTNLTADTGNIVATAGAVSAGTTVTAGTNLIGRFAHYTVIPIEWCHDGAAAPDAAEEVTSGNGAVQVRQFGAAAGDTVHDVVCPWHVPFDIVAGSGIKFMVTGALPDVDTIANQSINFKMSGYSVGLNDSIGQAFGGEVETELTGLTAAQFDAFQTPFSGVVTVTNLAGGEMAQLHFERDTADDDYDAPAGVEYIVVKCERLTAGF